MIHFRGAVYHLRISNIGKLDPWDLLMNSALGLIDVVLQRSDVKQKRVVMIINVVACDVGGCK